MESNRKCESDNEVKKSCNVMTLDEEIKILGKLRGGMNAAAVGITFRSYFFFSDDTLFITQFGHK
jgi:hypothetical protein